MRIQNLKIVALPIPQIIGGTQKIWAVPGYAHAPFPPKFFTGFCSDGPYEYIGQICSLVDNAGVGQMTSPNGLG